MVTARRTFSGKILPERVGIWLMNGTVHVSSVNLGNVDKQWKIVGSDDFNGDGKTDILWQHSSGARSIWLMQRYRSHQQRQLGQRGQEVEHRRYRGF